MDFTAFAARRLLLGLLAGLALAACTPAHEPAAAPPSPAEAAVAAPVLEPLEIVTDAGTVRLRVAIADTEEERAQGLMFRSVLEDDEGMLFDFQRPRPVAFWMKNTLIPLDMIFIGADGRIVNIAENTEPYSLKPVPSAGPVVAVLEIAGGRAAALGVEPGDRVLHRIFPGA